jgi:hypothetical protein
MEFLCDAQTSVGFSSAVMRLAVFAAVQTPSARNRWMVAFSALVGMRFYETIWTGGDESSMTSADG